MSRLRWRAHRLALEVYRRLPVRARRGVVRAVGPTYTVGALAVVERADGHILLIRQVYRRDWGLPGGLLRRREAPATAVVREVAEEVGLTIEIVGQGTLVADLVPRRFDFIYRARPVLAPSGSAAHVGDGVVRPVSPELRAAAWFPPGELPSLQFETRTALRALAEPERLPYVIDGHVGVDKGSMS